MVLSKLELGILFTPKRIAARDDRLSRLEVPLNQLTSIFSHF
jgi:hypothetical protein